MAVLKTTLSRQVLNWAVSGWVSRAEGVIRYCCSIGSAGSLIK